MKKISMLQIHSLRKQRNSHIVERLRNGDSLSSFNSQASWFPPRPLVDKDRDALQRLYGKSSDLAAPAAKSHNEPEGQTAELIELAKNN